MTKYELLYGVTIEEFPNERENVKKKLRLAMEQRAKTYKLPYSFDNNVILHAQTEAIEWCNKILKDINNE